MITRTILAVSLAATTLSLGSVPAAAGSLSKAQVSYTDLDLNSDAGASELRTRIRRAAQSLCVAQDVRPLSEVLDGMRCRRDALAQAETQFRVVLARARSERTQAAAE